MTDSEDSSTSWDKKSDEDSDWSSESEQPVNSGFSNRKRKKTAMAPQKPKIHRADFEAF